MTLDTSLGQKKGGEDQRAFQLDPCVTVVELNAMCLMGSIDSEWSIFDFIRQAPLMQVLPRPLKSKGSSVMSIGGSLKQQMCFVFYHLNTCG